MPDYTAASTPHGVVRPSIVPLIHVSGAAYLAGELDPDPEAGPTDGLLTVNNVPAAREIEVRHRRTRVVVGRTWSASDGTWRVGGLSAAERYDVIARDHTGTYQDVIIGDLTPYLPA